MVVIVGSLEDKLVLHNPMVACFLKRSNS